MTENAQDGGVVRRWKACFGDASLESEFRQFGMADQRKRGVVMLCVIGAVSAFSLINDLLQYQSGSGALLQIFLTRLSVLGVCATAALALGRTRLQAVIHLFVTICGLFLVGITVYVVAYHPVVGVMAPTTVVGAVALIYFFAPLPFPTLFGLATLMSVGGWIGWAILRGPQTGADSVRLFLWLTIVNVVGFLGSNAFHRTQRALFWEKRQLERQKIQAERAYERERMALGQFKQFAELISHEFRNPLAIVKGKAQLLQLMATLDGAKDPDALPAIERAVDRLDTLFSQWLASDRLAEGDIPFHAESVALTALMRRVTDDMSRPGQDVTVAPVPPGLSVSGDPILLALVLSNLIDNAGKYSPKGGAIQIAVSQRGQWAILQVRDHGMGIAPDLLDRVFEKYYRVSTDSGIRGFGLGLFLVRRIAEMHGGSVGIDSTLGKGTTVSLSLPLEPSAPRL